MLINNTNRKEFKLWQNEEEYFSKKLYATVVHVRGFMQYLNFTFYTHRIKVDHHISVKGKDKSYHETFFLSKKRTFLNSFSLNLPQQSVRAKTSIIFTVYTVPRSRIQNGLVCDDVCENVERSPSMALLAGKLILIYSELCSMCLPSKETSMMYLPTKH